MALYDLSLAAKALSTLDNFPLLLSSMDNDIASINLGPWTIHTNCHYDMELFAGKTNTFDYSLDFETTSVQLKKSIEDGYNNSRRLLVESKAEMMILKTMVTDIGQELSKVSTAVQQLPAITTTELVPLLQQIDTLIVQNIQSIQTEQTAFKTYSDTIASIAQDLLKVDAQALSQDTEASLARLNTFLKEQPCGAADALVQFDGFKQVYTQSVSQLNAYVIKLGQQTSNAFQSLLMLNSDLSKFQTLWSTALAGITAASTQQPEVSDQQRQDILSAINAWHQLDDGFNQLLINSKNPFSLV